ncbi:MAG: YraN family protein [Vulcanimicrobiaceae bacterium]
MDPRELARTGEDAAVALLRKRGYEIVGRNIRMPGGEIDVVARDGNVVVFVEVKARESRRFGSALSAVNARKRRTLRRLAGEWLQLFAPRANARFDVVAADGAQLEHYKDAFR